MLGERLLANRAVTEQQLQVALENQRQGGALLGDTLLALNFVSEQALSQALAEEAGVPFVVLNGTPGDPAAAALVPEAFARRHQIAPLRLRAGLLEILQANPFDVIALDELARITRHRLVALCGTYSDVARLIERSYRQQSEPAAARMDHLTVPAAEGPVAGAEPSDGPGFVLDLVEDAISRGASDLHIETDEQVVRLRYRVDGVLTPGDTLSREAYPSLLGRIKAAAGLDPAEQRRPQDGRILLTAGGRQVALQVATFPTVHGERVTIRILEPDRLVRDLADLGLTKRNLGLVLDLIAKPRGLVLVAGPSGAGKTTTVYSVLAELGGRGKNVLTVEDPVEGELRSVSQTQVNPAAGVTLATGIRSALRQDPDVVMISEIRDPEAARLALAAARSGVLVLSTVDAPDSAGALQRLIDMGTEPHLLASATTAVVAQRLVRVICPNCRQPARCPPESLLRLGLDPDRGFTFFRGAGCDRCRGAGYRGRTGAFEILVVDASIHALIREQADARRLRAAAIGAGMKRLVEDALQKAIFGQTTIDEVLGVASESG